MRFEWWILIGVYLTATGILLFLPKHKLRLAVVAFLFKQMITFIIGLLVVEWDLIEYPIRLFADVNRTSFTFEYYAFPTVCAAFNVWYPDVRSKLVQAGYYIGYTSLLTIVEVTIERYTELANYIHWEWYVTWVTVCLSFYLTRKFCVWFFKL